VPQPLIRASANPGWLPTDVEIDGLDALREKHLKALAVRNEASDKRSAVIRRHEQEDKKRKQAMLEQARGGNLPNVKQPDLTVREAELAAADEVFAAASQAFEQTVVEICDALAELSPAVDSFIAQRHVAAVEARREAQEILDRATAQLRGVQKLHQWFDRMVPARDPKKPDFMWAMAWSDLPVPPPDEDLARSQVVHGGMVEDLDLPSAEEQALMAQAAATVAS
jgi:hypothetical protein